jgi:hypothetical protein
MRKARFKLWIVSTDACPYRPWRAERHGFEYYRHGTLSLYAALNPQTGQLIGQTAARHTSQESFWIWDLGYLDQVVWTNPLGKRGLNLLRRELNVHTCCQDRFVKRKFVCRARDQTFRDAANTGF